MPHTLKKPAAEVFNQNAELYEVKYMDITAYKKSLDVLIKLIKNVQNALELGCGPGNLTQYVLNNKPELAYLATDIAPKMLEIAQKNAPLAKTKLLDIADVEQVQMQYDVLICGFILPYLNLVECASFIKSASKILNPNAYLYLSTMEAELTFTELIGPSTGKGPKLLMHFYDFKQLSALLTSNGFNIEYTEHIPFTDNAARGKGDLIIIAKLNRPN